MAYLAEIENILMNEKILSDSEKDRMDAAESLKCIRHILTLLPQKKTDKIIACANSDPGFINTWGVPTHYAVFRKEQM